ncbi:hypothetical protein [Neptuniibacter marinus]|uniref:hypothetical protein n=1 Tax=Neptuniibacter marinus TaxID=1806670 RepID=UPI003B5A5AFE
MTNAPLSLENTLLKVCWEKLTGTVFIASESNRSGQIVINQGALIGLNYCGLSNEEAFKTLVNSQNLRCSFTPDLLFPIAESLQPEAALHLLKKIGYSEEVIEAEPAPIEAPDEITDKASTVIYRGQVVERKKAKPKIERKKSGLVYRGQVIS